MPRGRGRGRGRSGGNRGGRGRSGRSYRAAGGRSAAVSNAESSAYTGDISSDPKGLFTGTASTEQHLEAQKANIERYAAALAVLIKSKVQITQNARIRCLAMSWARGDGDFTQSLLQLRSQFGLVEVLRAITMLDAGRQMRVIEKQMKCLQLSGNKVNPQKIGKLKSNLDNLRRTKPSMGSASGVVCKQVAQWVRTFSTQEIEFFAIHFPKEPWKKLADICHLNPSKDFPSAPWFLPYCFGTGTPPVDSVAYQCQNLTAENVNSLVMECDIPYSILKQFNNILTDQSKARIAELGNLDTILWYYEDLRNAKVDHTLYVRLLRNDPVNLPNGKLLERLLTFLLLQHPELNNCQNASTIYRNSQHSTYHGAVEKEGDFLNLLIQAAEPRLTSINLSLESPVVVIGDASSSMSVAIRTSTIIASLLTSICSAHLVFFNTKNIEAPFLPKTINEMLRLAVTTSACGATAPAASLYPYYERKEVIKTFIMVTDEEENTPCQNTGLRFTELYKKYYEEVYPANLVFVSFLRSQHAEGQMVQSLKNAGFHPKQLRLEGSRPDLTRLDDLFAQLSASTTSSFSEELEAAQALVKTSGLKTLYDSIQNAGTFAQDEE